MIHPGLEELLTQELTELGCEEVKAVAGGVTFRGSFEALHQVHQQARLPGRVLLRLGKVKADRLESIAHGVRSMPWTQFVHPKQPLNVEVTVRGRPGLRGAIVAKKVEHAIADTLRGPRRMGARPPREPAGVWVRVEGDRALISVDASGHRLHQRGWKQASVRAPLRENLAAAMLRGAGWTPGTPLVDPFCGSGTFLGEALRWAGNLPTSTHPDDFAYLRWPCMPKLPSLDQARPPSGRFYGSDRNPQAIEAAAGNLRRAGGGAQVQLQEASFAEVEPPAPSGLLIANPPYGRRVGTGGVPDAVFGHWRQLLASRWAGWRIAMLLPRGLAKRLLPSGEEVLSFSHGGLSVVLMVREPKEIH